jgi:serine/threonine protein kinase
MTSKTGGGTGAAVGIPASLANAAITVPTVAQPAAPAGAAAGSASATAAQRLRQRIREPLQSCQLGLGTFGQVFQALDLETGALVAVKKMTIDPRMRREQVERLVREINIMKAHSHANVIAYVGAGRVDDSALWIVMECAVGGSVARLIERFGPLPEALVRIYVRDCIEGLRYLHAQSVAHRDIKCENLLLCDGGRVKLADFGCAKKISEEEGLSSTVCGTPLFMAPEVALLPDMRDDRRYDVYAADVWTLGITTIQMLAGGLPFTQLQWSLICGDPNATVKLPPNLSPECTEFIESCLRRNPKERLTVSELAQLAFFRRDEPVASPTVAPSGDTPPRGAAFAAATAPATAANASSSSAPTSRAQLLQQQLQAETAAARQQMALAGARPSSGSAAPPVAAPAATKPGTAGSSSRAKPAGSVGTSLASGQYASALP